MADEKNNSAVLDEKAAVKQGEEASKANAEYTDPVSAVAAPPLPQLPDLSVLKEQQEEGQGGEREPAVSQYDDVKIADDGTRSGKKSS